MHGWRVLSALPSASRTQDRRRCACAPRADCALPTRPGCEGLAPLHSACVVVEYQSVGEILALACLHAFKTGKRTFWAASHAWGGSCRVCITLLAVRNHQDVAPSHAMLDRCCVCSVTASNCPSTLLSCILLDQMLVWLQAVEQYQAAEVVWCQEEPKNMGAWRYVKPRYETAMRELVPQASDPQQQSRLRQLRYVGRAAAASPGECHLSCLSPPLSCTILIR